MNASNNSAMPGARQDIFVVPQWINWKLASGMPGTKAAKLPIDARTGEKIDPHQPARWMTHDEAQRLATLHGVGIGFVFTEADPFVFIDIDKCRAPDGSWSDEATGLYHEAMSLGAVAEISQSGAGLHAIVIADKSKLSDCRSRFKLAGGQEVEVYRSGRFMALGQPREQWAPPVAAQKDATEWLLGNVPARDAANDDMPLTEGPRPEYTGPADDDALIGKMLASAGSVSAQFGAKATVADLWNGDAIALGGFYPSSSGDAYDRSAADAALMSHLAFWTGADAARMDRLFRRSGLMRDKFERRSDYRASTIASAISNCRKVYDRPAPAQMLMPGMDVSAVPVSKEAAEYLRNFMNEAQAADLFAAASAGRFRYVSANNAWFAWDGMRWAPDIGGSKVLAAIITWLKAIAATDQHCASMSRSDWKRMQSLPMARNVMTLLAVNIGVATGAAEFDADRYALNTPAGIVDLRTGAISPHDPSRLMTKITPVAPSDAPSPLWLSFLDQTCRGDAAFVDYLQKIAAWALTGDVRYEKFFLIHGDGGSGKSAFLGTLLSAIGADYASTARTTTFLENRNEAASSGAESDIIALRNARLVVAEEMPINAVWNSKRIKAMTGNAQMTARANYSDDQMFRPQMTLILASNHRPRIRDVDESYRRRLRVLPFTNSVPVAQQDTTLKARLEGELGGVLRWAIDGLAALWRDSLDDAPAVVMEASADYLDDEDIVTAWVDERCDRVPGGSSASSVAYQNFKSFIGPDDPAMSIKDFVIEVLKRGFTRKRVNSGWRFMGFELKPIIEPGMPNISPMPGTTNVYKMPGM